jgi:glutamate--cysteine ligase
MSCIVPSRLNRFETLLQQQGIQISRGIEKEGLRVDKQGFISQTRHPQALGHPLTHSYITTDYSEALLELITPVEHSIPDLLQQITDIQVFVHMHLKDEVMWSASMPCKIDGNESIPIAQYGDSNLGKLKHIYRKGLDVRYGRIMQSIAGLHFNFSLDDDFWQTWQQAEQGDRHEVSFQDFKSINYFDLIRNFRRNSWLLMYLFGASPAIDTSFLGGRHPEEVNASVTDESNKLQPLDNKGTWFKPYATSLRMGDLGYHNNAQESLNICFNTLDNFTRTLTDAIHRPYAPYESIGLKRDGEYLQLNCNILQIENEYYSSIRPKRTIQMGEKPIHALKNRGVEYIEVRCLDLNPYTEAGINEEQVRFMDLFLIYCLLCESPVISDDECLQIENNFSLVVNQGRKPGLILENSGQKISLKDWATDIIENMSHLAEILDKHDKSATTQSAISYRRALKLQVEKLLNPAVTPSGKILNEMRDNNKSWLEWAYQQSNIHQVSLRERGLSNQKNQLLSEVSSKSLEDELTIKSSDGIKFDQYLSQYTQ